MGLFSLIKIVKAHYRTLLEESNGYLKVCILFAILPILISVVLIRSDMFINSNMMTTIVSMLAILIGFSINAVFILIDSYPDETSKDLDLLFEGTRNITLYSIIFGIFTLFISGLILVIFINKGHYIDGILIKSLSIVVFFTVSHYFVTLLLLPARLYVIVETQI